MKLLNIRSLNSTNRFLSEKFRVLCQMNFSLGNGYLRILFHHGSYKDKFRKKVSWFPLCQDVSDSETLLKKRGHRPIFRKKWSEKVSRIP